MFVHIYGLVDPRHPSTIRYVGKSKNARHRARTHLYNSRLTNSVANPRLVDWLRSLDADGTKPSAIILEVCHVEDWEERERCWISLFRPLENLLNIASGGNGVHHVHEETRRRQSRALTGRKLSDDHRKHISIGQLGNKRSLRTREILSSKAKERGTDHMRTPEATAKKSASLKGRIFSAEHRQKISDAAKRRRLFGGDLFEFRPMLGRKHSDETKAKMHATHARRLNT